MDIGTEAQAATEPMTLEQMAESLIEPEANEDADDETTNAPDTEEDQTEVDEDDAEDAEDAEDDADADEDGIDEETEDSEEQLFTVKTDGKTERVTLDELKRGYSGQKYIQSGMADVAEARKQVEAQQSEISQATQQLNYLIQAAQQGAFVPPTPPDAAMLQTDPIGYMEQKAKFDQQAAQYNQNLTLYQQQQQAAQQRQQADYQSYLAEQRTLLHQAIPELADESKSPAIQQKMADVGMSFYRFTQEELQGLSDSRFGKALYDLMKYQELLSAKEKVIVKAKKAPPVAKAGAKTDQKRGISRKQRERLKKEGSIDAAMSLMIDPNFKG